jgi:hypothetical protein
MKTRVSINLHQKAFEMMDCRVTPGNDVRGSCSDKRLEIRHTSVMRQFPPRRIVCLAEETVETLYPS